MVLLATLLVVSSAAIVMELLRRNTDGGGWHRMAVGGGLEELIVTEGGGGVRDIYCWWAGHYWWWSGPQAGWIVDDGNCRSGITGCWVSGYPPAMRHWPRHLESCYGNSDDQARAVAHGICCSRVRRYLHLRLELSTFPAILHAPIWSVPRQLP